MNYKVPRACPWVSKGNRKKGGFTDSQNLRRDLLRVYDERQYAEKKALFGGKSERKLELKLQKPEKAGKYALTPYVKKSLKIRMQYNGKTYKAVVRKDGSIFHHGNIYASPSLAAKAIRGHAVNGWVCWRFQLKAGDWVLLDELRKA